MAKKARLPGEKIPKPKAITAQQMHFCEIYVSNVPFTNPRQAALEAGYSEGAFGYYLLKTPKIQAYIKELREEARMRLNVTIDDCIKVVAKIAFADIRDLYDEHNNLKNIRDLDDMTAAAVSSIEVGEEKDIMADIKTTRTISVKFRDKLSAVKLLTEMLGYKENELKIMRDSVGRIIGTEESVKGLIAPHKVIFTDNSDDSPIQEAEIVE